MSAVTAQRRRGPSPKAAGTDRGITEFRLDNGTVRVTVWDYGATVVGVEVRRVTGWRNLAFRWPDVRRYTRDDERTFVGSTVGRFARIVANGAATIDGQAHQLTRNAGRHHIHGGRRGFDARWWTGTTTQRADAAAVEFTLTSPDGDEGYPGTLWATATFELAATNRLTIELQARTDAPTLCGMCSHVFWNLGDTNTIDGHELQVCADRLVDTDAEFVPNGWLIPVQSTRLDLRTPRSLRGQAIDDFFVLSHQTPAAVLTDPEGATTVVVGTDQTGMAVYTGDRLPGRHRAGICLQPGPWPLAPGVDFPGSRLYPNETYCNRTTFDVVDNPNRAR